MYCMIDDLLKSFFIDDALMEFFASIEIEMEGGKLGMGMFKGIGSALFILSVGGH